MNNKFEVVVYWSEQDGHFLAEAPELPSNHYRWRNPGRGITQRE
jgi:hypothetical protein